MVAVPAGHGDVLHRPHRDDVLGRTTTDDERGERVARLLRGHLVHRLVHRSEQLQDSGDLGVDGQGVLLWSSLSACLPRAVGLRFLPTTARAMEIKKERPASPGRQGRNGNTQQVFALRGPSNLPLE